jgi:hypothetical protein
MDFKHIIKQEWEKEFKTASDSFDNEEPFEFENSLFQVYNPMVERICAKIWNHVVTHAAAIGYNSGHGVETEQAILRLKIDEQGGDTTEI